MKIRRILFALVLVLAAVLGFVSCGSDDCSDVDCGACPPAVTFEIVEAGTGARVDHVIITNTQNDSAGLACEGDSDGGSCTWSDSPDPGTITFTFTATGHTTVKKTVTIPAAGPGCCACAGLSAPVAVALPRL